MKVAALDLGTNTFLCLIAEVESGQITKIYEDRVQVVRLGQDVNRSKSFHPEALARARLCLADFKNTIMKHTPAHVLAMATSAARDVNNSEELFSIGKILQIPIEIIPGAREAEITYQGSISGQQDKSENFIVLDIGGGSTEIISGQGQKLLFSKSLDIGCVRLTEKFLLHQPPQSTELELLTEEVRKQINSAVPQIKKQSGKTTVLAVAGTPTELAKILVGEFIVEKIDGQALTLQQLETWRKEFSVLTPAQITEKFKVSPGRADVLLVGVIILEEFCRALSLAQITVSTRGVRFGVALEIERRERTQP